MLTDRAKSSVDPMDHGAAVAVARLGADGAIAPLTRFPLDVVRAGTINGV